MTGGGLAAAPNRRIETERLVLQPIPLATARALVAGLPVPGLIAGPGWPQPDTMAGLALDVAAADLAAAELAAADLAADARTGWFVVLRATGEVIGDCGWRGGPNGSGDAELGYGLAAPVRGHGYGAEAIGALAAWCARQPGVRRLIADVLPGNTPSRRLVEGLGFTLLGTYGDHLRYARRVRALEPAEQGT